VPALREVPLADNTEALAFGGRWLAGEFDVLVLLTGVGARRLVELLETAHPRDAVLAAFRSVTVVARGPKPVRVLQELGLKPDVTVPEPNTWRDLLRTLDESLPVAGKRVAVQEYGESNAALLDGLEERGAAVTRVPIYAWAMPEDARPLEAAVRELAEGRADAAVFTSAVQVRHLVRVAQRIGLGRALRAGLQRCVVASVGPTTSEALRAHGLPVDVEPAHARMGQLVLALAARARGVLEAKRAEVRVVAPPAPPAPPAVRLAESPFLKACRREPVPHTPIWLMRQAGRYLGEYRALREERGFLDVCRDPNLAAEVTVNAVERLGVDAAILFSDLLVVCEPMGFPVAYTRDDGPVIDRPIRRAADVDRLVVCDPPKDLAYVMQTVARARAALPPDVPLIGFAGAPFTLASYLIEGEGSRHFVHVKAFMHRDEGAWSALMERLVAVVVPFLNAQIAAGAQAVQVFDSWVGCLSPDDYRRFVLPWTKRVFDGLDRTAPAIHFGTGTAALLELVREAGGTVIGVDWRVRLGEAWDRIGRDRAIMGNLDPAVLFAPPPVIRAEAKRILDEAGGRPGHVFNLGHGILPGTPVEHVQALVEFVREASRR
jgi:uroporphyrinogen decarboxylase